MGLAVVASFVIDRALPVAVALAGLFWLIRWLAYGRPSQRTPADWAIFLLILMIPVTLWATALPEKTLPQVYRLLAGIALYYAIVNWANTLARLRWLEWALIAAGLLLAVIAPFSVQWSINKLSFFPDAVYSRFPLFVEDTVHPNVMAGSLIILLPLPLAWLLFTKERRLWPGSLLAALALLGMLAILVLTKSRSLVGTGGSPGGNGGVAMAAGVGRVGSYDLRGLSCCLSAWVYARLGGPDHQQYRLDARRSSGDMVAGDLYGAGFWLHRGRYGLVWRCGRHHVPFLPGLSWQRSSRSQFVSTGSS